MVRYRDTLWCDGCGIEIRWKPVGKDQANFCCEKCLDEERCQCTAVLEEYPTRSTKQPGIPFSFPFNTLADA